MIIKNNLKQKFVFLGVLASSSFSLCCAQQQTTRPNIIVFLVDDMGWQDTSVPFWNKVTDFNRRYHTPNMERLAAEGMKFNQAYTCSISSPSRVSLLTGMNAARHRVTNWTLQKNTFTDGKSNLVDVPYWNVNGITPYKGVEHATYMTALPELLRQSGYYTIHCGKANFGAVGTPGADPLTIGYNVNVSGHAAGAPGSYLSEDDYGLTKKNPIWAVPDLEEFYGTHTFLSEALTIKALREVDKARETKKPFFLYMAHYAVHIPYSADPRFIDKYKDLDPIEAKYATLIEGMDKSLGDIMDYLKKNKLDQNTIILFMSDNGGLAAANRGGELNTQNRPLASGKGSAYEGGVRVPMIVKWPGTVKPNTTTNDYVMVEDFFPSILQMAQVKHYTTVQKVDGQSFVPILKQQKHTDPNRVLIWHYPNIWGPSGPGIGPSSSIRQGDWKLIYYHDTNKFELFNIKNDIGEYHDLAAQNPGKVETLAKTLEQYLKEENAQMPISKATGQVVPYPYTYLKNSKAFQ